MRFAGGGGGTCAWTLPGRGGGNCAGVVYGEPEGEKAGDGAWFGNGDVMAAGLFKLSEAGPRFALITAGASFQPPFSCRLGGGGADGVLDDARGGGGTIAAWGCCCCCLR